MADPKIGYVDLDRILRDSRVAQVARRKFEREVSKRKEELSKTAEQFKKMQDDLEKNSVVISEQERRRRSAELNNLSAELQRRQRDYNDDLNELRNEQTNGVLARANRAVQRVAESEQYDIIFQRAVWINPAIDITDKVITALDDGAQPVPEAK